LSHKPARNAAFELKETNQIFTRISSSLPLTLKQQTYCMHATFEESQRIGNSKTCHHSLTSHHKCPVHGMACHGQKHDQTEQGLTNIQSAKQIWSMIKRTTLPTADKSNKRTRSHFTNRSHGTFNHFGKT